MDFTKLSRVITSKTILMMYYYYINVTINYGNVVYVGNDWAMLEMLVQCAHQSLWAIGTYFRT